MSWPRLLWNNFVVRPFKNYNVSARAEKVLKKEKPDVAPVHPTTVELPSGKNQI